MRSAPGWSLDLGKPGWHPKLIIAIGLIGAAGVGMAVGGSNPSLRLAQTILGLSAIAVATVADRHHAAIPWPLRPITFLLIALFIGTLSTGNLSASGYEAYFELWIATMAGIVLGVFITPHSLPDIANLSRGRLAVASKALFAVATVSAIAFFVMQGVPLLTPNIESSRIELAESGTGYFRLLAYMAGPAALIIFATGQRSSWMFVVGAFLIILLLGNRSPLLYLLIPLVVGYVLSRRTKFRISYLMAGGAVLLLLIASFGTYRIASQTEFQNYAEYQADLASRDYPGIARTAVDHYARTLPSNTILVKDLVDDGVVPQQYGRTFGTLFATALPGEQIAPDLLIRQASQKNFVGGGIPPTLAGEGYLNGKLVGVILVAALMVGLLKVCAKRFTAAAQRASTVTLRTEAVIYGYVVAWTVGAQTAGLAGASTVPLAGFIVLVALRVAGRSPSLTSAR